MNWISGEMAVWLAGFVVAAWAAPRRWHPHVLAVVGMAFLGRQDPRSLVALLGLATVGHFLVPGPGVRAWRVALVTVAVAAMLAWTRRFGTAAALPTAGPARAAAFLGLSYYGLRIVHVAMERFQGRLRATSFAEYLGYLAFFPALIAGPIHRGREFLHDQNRRRWDSGLFAVGMERILYGLVKVVVFGNYIVAHLDQGLRERAPQFPAWQFEVLTLFLLAANGYFQFAGYSDVAIGAGNLTGYRLMENFNWPFFATNIRDFWQRWHASLSQWCRDHVFTPTSARFRNPYAGVALSMVVLGLWHEISLRYLVFGLWHAGGIAVWHAFQALKPRLPAVRPAPARAALAVAGCLLTLSFYAVSLEFPRNATLREAWAGLVTIFTLKGGLHV